MVELANGPVLANRLCPVRRYDDVKTDGSRSGRRLALSQV